MHRHLLDESLNAATVATAAVMLVTLMAAVRGLTSRVVHQLRHDIDRDWEDDGAILLRRNIVESLQVAQLHRVKEHIIRACLAC